MRRTRISLLLVLGMLAALLPMGTAPAGAVEAGDPMVNEFVFNHDGTDTNEFVEVFSGPGADLSGFAIVEIEGDGADSGAAGLIDDGTAVLGTADGLGYWSTGPLGNTWENGSVTLLLVEGYTGAVGQDLDTDDDGTLDVTPWERVVDGVAVDDGGASDLAYASVVLSAGFDGVAFAPGGASRIPNGSDTDTVADWMRNDFDRAGLPGVVGTPTVGEALNTPSAVNEAVIAPPPVAGVLINEVDSDTPGTDVLEFVELYDGGVGGAALDGLSVVFYNGSGDVSYAAYDLDGFVTDAHGYFVLGNAGVVGVDVVFASNGLQNGADAVAVYADDASDFPSGTAVTTDGLVDAVVYDTADGDDAGLLVLLNAGQPQVNEAGAGDKDNHSNQRCPNGTGDARNTDTYAQFAPTPGAANDCTAPVAEVKIHDVQGNGLESPLVGQTVVVEGIVVGDFQDGASGTNGDLNGFHVQEEDADADADPVTSEGIFVYNGSSPAVNVAIGDLVQVEGSVSEFNGMTQITSFTGVTRMSAGNVLPTVTILSLPVTSVDAFEPYEGMYVTFPQALVISEYFNFDRFNEIVLTSERHLTPTAEFEPGPDAIQAAQDYLLDKITLDDGRTASNPDPAIHPNGGIFDLTNLFRGGDTVANVTGVVDYSFGLYRIQPTQGADYTSVNGRTASPADVGGNLKVASFNVLNYFTTLDYPSSDPRDNKCGPFENQGCRGADDANEFTRQRDKIIAALAEMDADVVGLIEIENYPGDVPTADLVSGLNDVMGAGTYDYVTTGAIGSDAIRVAFIYKPAAASLVGGFGVLDSSVDVRFDDTKNRPVLAQTFMDETSGGVFTLAVNHLKSKGSACDDVGDPDLNDGAGNCNVTRTNAALALVDWLATDPTGSRDEDFLIIGDLNSYDKEDPIDAIVAGGYTDLIFSDPELGEDAYSYVFDGQVGYLDHALANAGLLDEVTGVTVWHINADEPDLIDYDTSFKKDAQDAIYAPDAYRSSDHDPVIIGLNVCDEIAPVIEAITATPDVLWPANHKYVEVTTTVVVDDFDPNPTIELVSVASSEPDNGVGDGNTVDDIVIVDDFTFKLRAERSGQGEGRTYTITYKVTDACGNEAVDSVMVFVPLNRRGGR